MSHQVPQVALITCSYAPDFERCKRLCASMDAWLDATMQHRVVVPARDLPLFRSLANTHRQIVAVEDVLPARFLQLPISNRWWLSRSGRPVRGWILQQLTKLSADKITQAEHIVFVDSDLVFLRPLSHAAILRDNRLRLHRIPGAKDEGLHLRWHHRAAELLGTTPRYFGSDYIGQLITWRRSRLKGLHQHIEDVQGRPWHEGVAHSLQVSEYILYGAYVDAILGLEASGHYETADDLCHCCWFPDEAEALATGEDTLRQGAFALLLQSNLGLTAAEELAIVRRVLSPNACNLEAC